MSKESVKAPVINITRTRSYPMSPQKPAPLDADAFESRVRQTRPDLFRYAFWLTRDPTLAEDLVQESLLRAWRAKDSLMEAEAFKPWLITIIRREFARHLDSGKARRGSEVDADTALAVTENTDVADVRRAIWRLPADYREPLVLQVLIGYPTAEIAELMEISQNAVLTRLHRARRKLREELKELVQKKVRQI